jgi:hypothetical protein
MKTNVRPFIESKFPGSREFVISDDRVYFTTCLPVTVTSILLAELEEFFGVDVSVRVDNALSEHLTHAGSCNGVIIRVSSFSFR